MPTDYEFQESSPPPPSEKNPTKWLVRELRGGKPYGHWKRLFQTPKGKYYLHAKSRQRAPYDGPAAPE